MQPIGEFAGGRAVGHRLNDGREDESIVDCDEFLRKARILRDDAVERPHEPQ